ncbi:rhomboid family member [Senna tora]|uniref:Rhomboid family member n=1 Tax=Senna tora TaxID=362788 RepID=A0A834SM17_9FABA|nr:rhomboid family member [Senna tora]
MNRRTRDLQLKRPDHFHKYLKPGALARIRDSRISARSHRLSSLCQISLHCASPPHSHDAQSQVNAPEGFPCFVGRIYGPRCPQRKKLVAAKSVFFIAAAPPNPPPDSTDIVIDSFSNDILNITATGSASDYKIAICNAAWSRIKCEPDIFTVLVTVGYIL